jgi:hypothetical protein
MILTTNTVDVVSVKEGMCGMKNEWKRERGEGGFK